MKKTLLTLCVLLIASYTLNASQNNNSLLGNTLVINEYQADPAIGLDGDANGDGTRDGTDDEFIEIYNTSSGSIDISNWVISDNSNTVHTFPNGTIIPGDCSIVVFGGGSPTGAFGFSETQVASSGSLSLNNSGDTITLKNAVSSVQHSIAYTSVEGNANQSITADPAGSTNYVEHSNATGSNGSLFSPGTNPDGSFFSGCPISDLPPVINSTNPDTNEGGVLTNTNITINFSEVVDVTANALTLNCGASDLPFTGLPASSDSIVLDPSSDLPDNSFCTVTAIATGITDNDEGNLQLDGNGDTNPGDNYAWTFITGFPNYEIWEIQGNSTATALDGFTVSSNDNIITALDTNGFYIQTPDGLRDDNDVNTSNGLFVYTGLDPVGTYAIGDQVDVNGKVIEFFGTTEFTTPVTVTIDSNNNPLPTALLLDDTFPPNDPTIPVCSTNQETHKYECLEGMHFNMPQGFISAGYHGSTFFANDDNEDVLIRAGSARAFREPGIDYPGDNGISPLVFDGNPEILELDFDSLGVYDINTLDYTQFAAGTEIAMKGIFGYEFDQYEIWPSEPITILNVNPVPGAVRNNTSDEATIASANLLRFFDDINDPGTQDDDTLLTTQEFNDKVSKLAKYIVNDLKSPMILALQEVENINTLNVLAAKILNDSAITYTPYLIEANDPGGIDVAYMIRDNVTPVSAPVALGTAETFISPVSGSPNTLHDRPPFYLQADIVLDDGTMRVNVLAIHNRSRGSIEDSNVNNAARVRLKRFTQANSVAAMIDSIQTNNPEESIIVLGDFNAFNFSDGYADVIGQITGTALESDNEYWSEPLFASSPLTQAVQTLSTNNQYSYVFGGSAQLLDNAILNDEALMMMNEIQFARGQADANFSFSEDTSTSLRVSDHDGFVLFITEDFDTIFTNGFE